jgi:hypothetical protein
MFLRISFEIFFIETTRLSPQSISPSKGGASHNFGTSCVYKLGTLQRYLLLMKATNLIVCFYVSNDNTEKASFTRAAIWCL